MKLGGEKAMGINVHLNALSMCVCVCFSLAIPAALSFYL